MASADFRAMAGERGPNGQLAAAELKVSEAENGGCRKQPRFIFSLLSFLSSGGIISCNFSPGDGPSLGSGLNAQAY